MGKVAEYFGNPGVRADVHQQASIPKHHKVDEIKKREEDPGRLLEIETESTCNSIRLGEVEVEESGDISTSIGFTGLEKNKTDRILDWLVYVAGSQFMFIIMLLILVGWIVAGIVLSGSYDWQVVMEDGQSIQCYIWDTLLMRQQLMSAHEHICICAELSSRITVFRKLLTNIIDNSKEKNANAIDHLPDIEVVSADLQDKNWYDKFSTLASNIVGSWYSIIIFWIGIFVWIGCGALTIDAGNTPPFTGETTGSNPKLAKFGNMWQMYINTAVAVQLYLCTVFLQNIRARHDLFIAKFLRQIFIMDLKIDTLLRSHSNDYTTEADIITIEAQKRTAGERMIDWYGDIIGTGMGVLIAIIAFTAWICVGHPMNWSDDWWLIIGTYTGLVGFFDGFVIRQVYFRIVNHEEENYEKVIREDYELFSILGIQCPENLCHTPISGNNKSTIYKVSVFINNVCSSELSVLGSIIFIIALIGIASGLRWSETGQLIANTPTMIIEGFFFLILLQAHNWADVQRRAEISLLYSRKNFLISYLQSRFGEKDIEVNID